MSIPSTITTDVGVGDNEVGELYAVFQDPDNIQLVEESNTTNIFSVIYTLTGDANINLRPARGYRR